MQQFWFLEKKIVVRDYNQKPEYNLISFSKLQLVNDRITLQMLQTANHTIPQMATSTEYGANSAFPVGTVSKLHTIWRASRLMLSLVRNQ